MPAFRAAMTPRARAKAIHDLTVAHARTMLSGRPGLTMTEQPGFLVVTVDDRVGIRYKKFDDDLGTCGIATTQRRLWNVQEPLMGMHELTYLVAGYQLDAFEQLAGAAITCSVGSRVIWYIDAPDAGLDDGALGSILPINPNPNQGQPATIVSSKRLDDRQQEA